MKNINDIHDLSVLQQMSFDELKEVKKSIDVELIETKKILNRFWELARKSIYNEKLSDTEHEWLFRNKAIMELIFVRQRDLVSTYNYLHEVMRRKEPVNKELEKNIDKEIEKAIKEQKC